MFANVHEEGLNAFLRTIATQVCMGNLSCLPHHVLTAMISTFHTNICMDEYQSNMGQSIVSGQISASLSQTFSKSLFEWCVLHLNIDQQEAIYCNVDELSRLLLLHECVMGYLKVRACVTTVTCVRGNLDRDRVSVRYDYVEGLDRVMRPLLTDLEDQTDALSPVKSPVKPPVNDVDLEDTTNAHAINHHHSNNDHSDVCNSIVMYLFLVVTGSLQSFPLSIIKDIELTTPQSNLQSNARSTAQSNLQSNLQSSSTGELQGMYHLLCYLLDMDETTGNYPSDPLLAYP